MSALKINLDPDESFDNSSNNSSNSSLNTSADYNDQLADKITTLAGQINAANYKFLKLIAEFDRREAWAGAGIRSCAHWLNWKCSIAMSAAREKVRTARALDGLPGINSAFEKGELSFSKVRAMTRVATVRNESHLLMIAQHGTAQHMEALVKAFRSVTRAQDAQGAAAISQGQEHKCDQARDQRQRDNRSVSCFQNDEGMWVINAKLPAEEGGVLVKVLNELGDQVANQTMGPVEQKSVSAETFCDISPACSITFPQRRADALVALSEHYLASCTDSSQPSLTSLKAAERCQLVLHVRDTASAGSNVNLNGRWLLPDAARRLACDAGLLVVKEDGAGNVLDIGRKSRIIPAAMSRALQIRDGGCQFPGCCESRYVEGHHIKHWADGGETKLDNLVTLCRYHHRELHRGAFFLSLKPQAIKPQAIHSKLDEPVRFAERLCFSTVHRHFNSPFSRSKNSVIAANPTNFTCACCDFSELEKTLNKEVTEPITKKTAVTKWLGEKMDLSMAVDGLLYARCSE